MGSVRRDRQRAIRELIAREPIESQAEIAARAPWKGTKQVRGFRFHDDKLTLSPPVSPDFVHGSVTRRSLTWRKVAPSA